VAANPNWESLAIEIPGKDLLEGARAAMEALVVYLEVVKAILESVKVFLVDFGNPIKALVEAVLKLVLDLFETMKRTGMYGWFDFPNPQTDPNFKHASGGYRSFISRFKAGLYDARDPNRPQPVAGTTKGGFVLIVADTGDPLSLMRYCEVLAKFFGKEFVTPEYQAPANFKVLPVGANGDRILSITKVYQQQPTQIAVEWSLPPVSTPGDPGFSDLIEGASVNFVPPKFLIEKSVTNPAVGEVSIADLNDRSAAGPVMMSQVTQFRARGSGEYLIRRIRLMDQYGNPFLKFQYYIVIDAAEETSTFLIGQLGTFRYIDSDVVPNKTYYYRVRAFSGSLAVQREPQILTFDPPKLNAIDGNPYLEWPAEDENDKPVMGRASPIAPIMIPTYPEKFDVIETLKRLFQTAFSFNFHMPLPAGQEIDDNGEAVPPTPDTSIGKGSLQNLAGPLTAFEAIPLVGQYAGSPLSVTTAFQPSPATGLVPEFPWNDSRVVRNAARLANIVGSAMLQANAALSFKALMEGTFPRGQPDIDRLNATNLAELVFEITKVQDPQAAGQDIVAAGVLYSKVFEDATVRLNVVVAVDHCKAFTLVGAPPDWVQLSLLRDIAPWSGQIIYELLAKMQALTDAYSGVMAELRAFIDLIVAKIDTLERFLKHLTGILDFVESLNLGFYILNVPVTDGGVGEWISLIDNAGGTPPPSGPTGYTAGAAMAYVAADVTPYVTALDLIF